MAQKFDARQVISRIALGQLLGVNGTELDDLLASINKEFNAPLRLNASSPADSKINFQPSEVEAADLAGKSITPISSQIPTLVASTIDFQTGATTGGTINITFPNSTVGFYRRVGFSLDASGTIQAIFSAESATLGGLANAGTVFVKGALPIGWIDLQATAASPGRFKTAGSTTNVIENKVGSTNTVHRIMGGGGTGSSGSGSGTGDDINALTFKASFTDLFSDLPTDSVSAVDYTAGKTDAATYDIVNSYHRLAYDATRTVTGTGTSMTLNIAPAFTIKAGDMLIVGTEARRITALASQTSITIESAFTTNPSAASCTLSQAVHTKDLNNFAGDGIAAATAFSTSISQVLLTYEDTTTANDTIFDANTTPAIAYSVSSDGSSYTARQLRPTNLSDTQAIVNLPTSSTNLYIRFFANKTAGTGSVNVLGYKVFFHRDLSSLDGSAINQSYCRTDNVGTKVNTSTVAVVGGKTRIKKTWSYPVNVNAGTSNGALKVYLDGQKIPRFVDGTVSVSAYYKEIDQNTIELDADYSSLPLEVEIVQDVAVVDASDTNTSNVASIQEVMGEGLQSFVKTSAKLNATTTVGSPATGNFYSSISNRASITDLTQDLKARMAIERIPVQQIYQLPNEFGPNGEPVWAAVNDSIGQFRFVGNWSSLVDAFGARANSASNTTDFVEITFYGTGINLLAFLGSANFNYVYSVDGGAESANIASASYSSVLGPRNYGANQILPVVSGLSLGVHTVKIRNNTASNNLAFYGCEVLTEVSTIRVQPGTSYVSGKKVSTLTQSSLTHNSTFESGTLGTRGGRVVVYQKADGSIAKAVQPVDASTLLSTAANHQNEEIARVYNFREFGAGRADDLSLFTNANAARAFTLEDGTTTLVGSAVSTYTTLNNTQSVSLSEGNGQFGILTFVGTGLDVEVVDSANGGSDNYTFQIDGGTAQSWPYTSGSTTKRTIRIASGLPYGTHTFRINRVTAATFSVTFTKFTVYQPKKPSIPSGAFEVADYNVMADYSASTASGLGFIPQGSLRKMLASRESIFTGTWTHNGVSTSLFDGGQNLTTATATSTFSYTFIGSGVEFKCYVGGGAATSLTVAIDGSSNLSGYTTSLLQTSTGTTFTAATGAIAGTAAAGNNLRLQIAGLTYGKHTITVTQNNTNNFYPDTLDVQTLIHSYNPNSNSMFDQQNTLPVGSCTISDNRKLAIVKEASAQNKNISYAIGISSGPSTTSTVNVPVPDMSLTHTSKTGKIKITYNIPVQGTNAGATLDTQLYVNGSPQPVFKRSNAPSAGTGVINSDAVVVNVPVGVNKVDLLWSTSAGTMSSSSTLRSLLVEDV